MAVPFGPTFGIAIALASSAFAQSGATDYYWSAYPNADTTVSFATGVAVDLSGAVYASSVSDHYITKISPAGTATALAGMIGVSGTADGAGSSARFNIPQGVAVDGSGTIYVAEFGSSTIRKISQSGNVTTIAGLAGSLGAVDGPAASARFNLPRGVAVDPIGNVYVTDWTNARIRMIGVGGIVYTLSGGAPGTNDGVGTIARYLAPWGIAIDRSGTLFVTDSQANTVRKITSPLWIASTIAGTAKTVGTADGVGAAARFNQPTGIAVDSAGNLFVTDTQNRTVRRIGTDGQVTTIGGKPGSGQIANDGIGAAATFIAPYAIAVTNSGILYVADYLGVRRGELVRAPAISVQPATLTVKEGAAVSLSVVASGSPPPTYQWRFNGEIISGATSATLTFNSVRAQNAGAYTVEISNSLGTVTSSIAALTVNAPPTIVGAPQATTIGADGTAQLSVAVSGFGPFTYQWLRDGTPISGATSATLKTGDFGNYSVAITNIYGTTTTTAVLVDFPARLANLSTSSTVGPSGNSLVSGVVVMAPVGVKKTLLIRAVGPALAQFGVPNPLAQTVVSLMDDKGVVIARNSGWATNPLPVYSAITETSAAVGAFTLPPGSNDSALLVDVPRGNFTVAVEGVNAATGGALLEIYEARADAGRLANLSTRGQVGGGGQLTVGFVASGVTSPNLLVRAVGPGLEPFGVTGVLKHPVLTIYSGSRAIASNAGWATAPDSTLLANAATTTGAFALARDSADSALLVTLLAGANYTAQVTSADGAPGAVLIEIYQVF